MYNKISNSNILLVVTKVALCPVPIQKTQKKKHRKWLQAFKETNWNFRQDTFNSCPVNLAFPSQLFSLGSFSNGSTELGKHVIGIVRLKANLNIFFLFIYPDHLIPTWSASHRHLPSPPVYIVVNIIGQSDSWFKQTKYFGSQFEAPLLHQCFLHLWSFPTQSHHRNNTIRLKAQYCTIKRCGCGGWALAHLETSEQPSHDRLRWLRGWMWGRQRGSVAPWNAAQVFDSLRNKGVELPGDGRLCRDK